MGFLFMIRFSITAFIIVLMSFFFSLHFIHATTVSSFSEWLKNQSTQEKLNDLTAARTTFNKITLLHLGKNSKPMRYKVLNEAKHTVWMTVPLWFDDQEGQELLEAFRNKKKNNPHLDLRIMVDFVSGGATNDFFGTGMLSSLKQIAGGDRVIEWNRPLLFRPLHWSWKLLDNRLHEKFFIVDGEKLIMGGMNIQNTYLQGGTSSEGWHDTDILIEGPAVKEALAIFMKNWTLVKYLEQPENSMPLSVDRETALYQAFYLDELHRTKKDVDHLNALYRLMNQEFNLEFLGQRFFELFPAEKKSDEITSKGTPVRLIYDNPLPNRRSTQMVDRRGENRTVFAPYSRVMETLQFLIENSKEEVKLFIPYLTIRSGFKEMLIRAAHHGVRVEILTNSLKSHDLGDTAYMGSFMDYPDLLKAGVKIYEWQGHEDLKKLYFENGCQTGDGTYWPGNTLHTKAAVVDGAVSLIGSHNMNMRSEQYNTEIMALIEDLDFSKQLLEIFNYALDLGEEGQLPCKSGRVNSIVRPRRVQSVSYKKVKQFLDENAFEAGLLRNFRIYM